MIVDESGLQPLAERMQRLAVNRGWNRLSDDARYEVDAHYEVGDTTTQLAKEFDAAKSTIIGILRERNVVVRLQPLSKKQVGEAARLINLACRYRRWRRT
ncbi:hypothetical protein [Microbacterium sp. 22296]|uniref:hypothetical protein n=1 Tax=Microbacterium sp. 22296 TaxID=3453903 RepID=UPI003F86BB30